ARCAAIQRTGLDALSPPSVPAALRKIPACSGLQKSASPPPRNAGSAGGTFPPESSSFVFSFATATSGSSNGSISRPAPMTPVAGAREKRQLVAFRACAAARDRAEPHREILLERHAGM